MLGLGMMPSNLVLAVDRVDGWRGERRARNRTVNRLAREMVFSYWVSLDRVREQDIRV